MRSRRTGSRSIRALPPTLPPAISTCARMTSEPRGHQNSGAGMDGAGRHHDDGSVRQSQLLLLHVELSDGEYVSHDPDGPFTCENVIKQRCGNERGSAP